VLLKALCDASRVTDTSPLEEADPLGTLTDDLGDTDGFADSVRAAESVAEFEAELLEEDNLVVAADAL
jgi:hypothetical protein